MKAPVLCMGALLAAAFSSAVAAEAPAVAFTSCCRTFPGPCAWERPAW
jgi:hypothetical protein